MSESPESPGGADQPTLYEIVGDAAIAEIVDRFYVAVLADPTLEPFFAQAEPSHIRGMQRAFFSAALGGPVAQAGSDIHDAHQHLGIGARDFSRFVGHLVDTLEAMEIDREVTDQLLSRVALHVDDVVGGHGEDG